MKITRADQGLSFIVTTKEGKIALNAEKGDLRVLLQSQKKDEDNMLHWPGEYEKNGVAVFLKDLGGKNFLGKIFVEHIRVVFFTDEGVEYSEDLYKEFGNTDVLVFEKGQTGFTESQTKKIIESIDPRMLIGTQGETMNFLKKLSLPMLPKEDIKISKSSLPAEHTEYYIV